MPANQHQDNTPEEVAQRLRKIADRVDKAADSTEQVEGRRVPESVRQALRDFMPTVRSSPNPESDEIRATGAALSKLHEAVFPEQYSPEPTAPAQPSEFSWAECVERLEQRLEEANQRAEDHDRIVSSLRERLEVKDREFDEATQELATELADARREHTEIAQSLQAESNDNFQRAEEAERRATENGEALLRERKRLREVREVPAQLRAGAAEKRPDLERRGLEKAALHLEAALDTEDSPSCETCGGRRTTYDTHTPGREPYVAPCPDCNGTGKQLSSDQPNEKGKSQ